MRPLRILLVLLFALAAHSQTPETAPTQAALMTALYGNYDAAHHWSIWTPQRVPKDYKRYFDTTNGRGRTSVAFDATYRERNTAKRLLVLATIPDNTREYECHLCSVLLSAAVFSADRTEPEARADFLCAGGQMGDPPPDISLITLSGSHTALSIEDEFSQGGHDFGWRELFAQSGSTVRSVLFVRTLHDDENMDACVHPSADDVAWCKSDPPFCFTAQARADKDYRDECTSWQSRLSVTNASGNDGWSDLLFTQTILAVAPGAYPGKQYVTRFRFENGKYQPAGPPSQGPRIDRAYYQ